MEWLILLGLVLLMFAFPKFRCVVFNIHKVLFYLPIDIFLYFAHRKYNNVPVGVLTAVIGAFGRGKTLTAVHIVALWYYRKNNKKVWCPQRKKMVKQRIKIISNVDLLIPHEKFVDMQQFFRVADFNKKYDAENDTLTVTLFLGDEFSVQLNNRQFKTNIDGQSLNTLLTCRHHYIALYYTTQRFQLVDALLRQVTQTVVDCRKSWRLQGVYYYDGWQLENASSPLLVQPYKRSCWFVRNKDYKMYDTLAVVENLRKAIENGDMMTEEEILNLQNPGSMDMGQVLRPSRQYKHVQKKMYK